MNCLKFNFGQSYLSSDSYTNSVISHRFAYLQDVAENRDKTYSIPSSNLTLSLSVTLALPLINT